MTGAVQMLCSVPSEPVKCSTSVYVLPAESVTDRAVALEPFQMPTSTTSRLPAVTGLVVATPRLTLFSPCAVAACTKAGAGGGALDGVTAFDGADAGPVPTALVPATVNVYVVPFVSPVTVVDVAGGLPLTVTGGCAVVP